MEYKPTNLPQYWKITPRQDFANAVVQEGHVLIFSQNGETITAKTSDGSFVVIGQGSNSFSFSQVTATASDVLAGKLFYNSAGLLVQGTIQTVTAAVNANKITIPRGFIESDSITIPQGGPITVQGNIVHIPMGYRAQSDSVSVAGGGATLRAGVVVSDSGVLYIQPLGFEGTVPHDSDSLQDFSNLMIFNTGHPQPDYPSNGGSSSTVMNFYKCASVDASNSTWTGYRFDPVNLEFESVTSTDLVYTSMKPVVGGIYDTTCLYRVSEIGGYVAQQLLFFPFTTDTNTVVGPTATLVSGTYTQDIIQEIYCLNCNSVDLSVAVSLYMPLSVCFWGKPTDDFIKISIGGVGDTTGQFSLAVTSSSIQTFKHNKKMYINYSIDNTSGLAFYCVTLQSTGNKIWKNGVQLDSYSGDFGSFPSDIIEIQITGYITNLRVFTKALTGNEITTLYNKLHPVIS